MESNLESVPESLAGPDELEFCEGSLHSDYPFPIVHSKTAATAP